MISSLLTKVKVFHCCFLLALLPLLSNCISNRKLVYFPDTQFDTEAITPIENNYPGNYRLQPRDIISVKVKTLDLESSEYFNIETGRGFNNFNPASIYLSGYSLDDKGNINLPEAGFVNVSGLTIVEAQNKIQESLSTYLNKATILVKLVSFRITVLGEVRNPGQYFIYNDQVTLLEGLGMAGDLTEFGNRENVTLIRQNGDKLGGLRINLRDADLLSSKFYYLQPNDVLYVQPLKVKNTRSNLNTLNIVSIIVGSVSTALAIVFTVRNL
jgi:polysaccharide biosynthesis/export protein